jgi:hypothetical protein
MELLERVVEADGQLLRAQCYAEGADPEYALVTGLLLTFDVGRILMWADQVGAGLQHMLVEDVEDLRQGMVTLDEEEPWWRILGSPLVRLWPTDDATGVRLQFRRDEGSPRYITLTKEGSHLRITLEPY